jgi:hypothetical protein
VSVLHEQGQRLRTTSRTALRVFVVPTFRKGRERWATHFVFYGREVKVPALSLQKTQGQGRGTRFSFGFLTYVVGAGQG